MSQTTLPDPAPETKQTVGGPLWASRTVWSTVVSAATGLPVLVSQLNLIPGFALPTGITHALLVIAVVAAWAAPLFARAGGVAAAARVAESTGVPVGTVPPGVGG